MNIQDLLKVATQQEASDLHLLVGSPPMLRIGADLVPFPGEEKSPGPVMMEEMFRAISSERQRERFNDKHEADFAYSVPGLGRFRVNASMQRNTLALSIRCLPNVIPPMETLGVPEICKTLVLKRRGLILVTGSTCSGKSTTQASMIDYLNDRECRKVITVESPIEFLHHNKKCLIAQREVGDDTMTFGSAMREALRQNADVILIGEMRDIETIDAALTAAETGHLVLGTAHSLGAADTIERIISAFPTDQQDQVRTQLSIVLEAVISQMLVPRADARGRKAVFEIMLATYAIRN
ncbi:MAG: type IV pili twitching motility protein PilT, partial [Chloroflexi bacterium RBG_13_52_14]